MPSAGAGTGVDGRPVARSSFALLEVGLTLPVESFLRAKLEGLARHGVDVTVAGYLSRGAKSDIPGVRFVALPPWWGESLVRLGAGLLLGSLRVALREPGRWLSAVRAARSQLVGGPLERLRSFAFRLRSYLPLALLDPDVVHFEWNTAAIHFLPMAEVWSCPTVVSCRGSDINVRPHGPSSASYVRALRSSFDHITAVHCVSDAIAIEASRLGMDPRRAWLIRPAVDTSVFHPTPISAPPGNGDPQPLRVVSIGELRWLKGHEDSVRAVANLVRQGIPVTLEIIGEDPRQAVGEESNREPLEHEIARAGLGDRVTLTGALPAQAVRERLQQADVLLHSSLTEGLPNVVLEAMACGLPVVVTGCGGVPEAVTDGIEGFVVSARDVDEVSRALATLQADPRLRQRMGEAGRRRVTSQFSLAQQLEDFLTMYEELRAGRSSSLPPAVALDPQLRVLSVGPLQWSQGLDDAIQAVRIVRDEGIDCRHRIVGDGPYVTNLHYARRQLELDDYVEFRRAAKLEQELDWADVLLDASLRDPPIGALASARSAGVPVITTRTLPAGDPRSIAVALVALGGPVRERPARASRGPVRVS